jgi:hypothetical protein
MKWVVHSQGISYLVVSWLKEHPLPQYIALTSPKNKPARDSNIQNFGRSGKADIKCPFCFPFPMHPVSVTSIMKEYIGNLTRPSTEMDKSHPPPSLSSLLLLSSPLKSFRPHFSFPPRRQPKSSPPLLHRLKSTAHSFSPFPICLYSSSGKDIMAPGGKVIRRKYLEQGIMFSSSVQLPRWIHTCVFSNVGTSFFIR